MAQQVEGSGLSLFKFLDGWMSMHSWGFTQKCQTFQISLPRVAFCNIDDLVARLPLSRLSPKSFAVQECLGKSGKKTTWFSCHYSLASSIAEFSRITHFILQAFINTILLKQQQQQQQHISWKIHRRSESEEMSTSTEIVPLQRRKITITLTITLLNFFSLVMSPICGPTMAIAPWFRTSRIP
jgi:hypothetical protein